ncbi:MAG: glycoside hydrolase family 3 N-terminal domain-containing protein, partial [Dermatophilaceae bacterium]
MQNLRYAVPARPTPSRIAALACVTAIAVTACGGSDATDPEEAGPSAVATTEAPPTTEATTEAPEQTCVTTTYEALSEDQRLGQLLMIGFDTNAPLDSLDDEIEDGHVGNVIYLGGWEGFEKVRSTSEHLRDLVSDESTGGIGLIIAADQEGGIVHQLRGEGFTRPPRALDQAQQSPAELTAAAAGWGEEIASAGVNLNLAPVADTVPEEIGTANEPIGRWGRQYGSDPAVVAEYV